MAGEAIAELDRLAANDIPLTVYHFDGQGWSSGSCSWVLGQQVLERLRTGNIRAMLHAWGGCDAAARIYAVHEQLGDRLGAIYLDEGSTDAFAAAAFTAMRSMMHRQRLALDVATRLVPDWPLGLCSGFCGSRGYDGHRQRGRQLAARRPSEQRGGGERRIRQRVVLRRLRRAADRQGRRRRHIEPNPSRPGALPRRRAISHPHPAALAALRTGHQRAPVRTAHNARLSFGKHY
jgi:hypothetical protein